MSRIERNPSGAAATTYDLIVIGGGVYGCALALEAARRGLRPLLLERHDFGGATSWNSLRIVHGGLRYLQTMDLRRFRESVGERRRFLRDFPDLVRPLTCVMPLYGDGLRRPVVLRAALAACDLLAWRRNAGVRPDRRLDRGRLLDPLSTRQVFPTIRGEGLLGAAAWQDAIMPASQRVIIEMLRWASACGATCLNYVEADSLVIRGRQVTAVAARDRETGASHEFSAPVIVNCAGPWCAELAARFDRPAAALFRPSLAFNLLIDRPAPSDVAVAIAPPGPCGRTYFVLPWHGRTLAGTCHAGCVEGRGHEPPTAQQIEAFLRDLAAASPGTRWSPQDVRWVFWGLLPATQIGGDQLATRESIFDHGQSGGPRGLFSVSGVKFTTARLVAEKVLQRIYVLSGRRLRVRKDAGRPSPRGDFDLGEILGISSRNVRAVGSADGASMTPATRVRAWADEEAVVHLDDLLLRRADWGADPASADGVAEAACAALGWDAARTRAELARWLRCCIETGVGLTTGGSNSDGRPARDAARSDIDAMRDAAATPAMGV